MICLAFGSKAFLSAQQKSQDKVALTKVLDVAKIELNDARRLEKKVYELIPEPAPGYKPAKADELMVSAILDLPRKAESFGMQVVKIETVSQGAAGMPIKTLMKSIPVTERVQQGQVTLAVKFVDIGSMRAFLSSVEDIGGYLISGKIRNGEANFTIGFLGV